VLYAGLMTLLWIPPWLCTVVGGFLFGTWLGTPFALVGACSGAVAVFILARTGFGGLLERAGPTVRKLEAGFRRNAFSYLLALRLIPVVPFVAINLAAAAVALPLRTFALATLIGIAPSTLIYASIGDALAGVSEGQLALDSSLWSQPRFVLPLLGLAALAMLPVLYRWVRGSRP
jgi:uncharacterized membrane protein YdjX (TVP38/TMEM64 family)